MNEVFEVLEIDPKRALKVIQKEIESRGKKLSTEFSINLRLVRALVLERNNRVGEARSEVLGVLEEIKDNDITEGMVLDTYTRTATRMHDSKLYMSKYLEVVEYLITKTPNNKDLTFTLYEGSL